MKQDKKRFLEMSIIQTKKVLTDLIEQESRSYNLYYQYKSQLADFKKMPIITKFNDITVKYIAARNVLNIKNSLYISVEVANEMAQQQLIYRTQLSDLHSDENVKKYVLALSGQKETKILCMFLTEERYRCEKFLEKAQKKLKKLTKSNALVK